MVAHVPPFGRNPGGSPDFLAYPVPKARMHVLGTRFRGAWVSHAAPRVRKGCAGLRMQPYPRAPDLVWPGHLHGTGCLSARAMDTGFPIAVCRLCLGPGCALVWVSVTPPALAGVSGGSVWVRFLVSPLFSRLGLAVYAVGLGFRPATPPFLVVVLGRAWLCARSACTPPFPVLVCGVGVRAGVRVSAAPRHSLGRCWGVCVFVCSFCVVSCTSCLGVRCGGVCLGIGCCRAPPLRAGVSDLPE